MNISAHFEETEFETNGPFPDDCLPVVTNFCNSILEPFHIKFGKIVITSGYRDPSHNFLVHGVIQSQHIYTPIQCAADCSFVELPSNLTMRDVFDWGRLESGLPIDQIILEHGETGDIIHLSFTMTPPRNEALEGLVGNRSGYNRWKFVSAPPIPNKTNS
jgi:hypothetical protein